MVTPRQNFEDDCITAAHAAAGLAAVQRRVPVDARAACAFSHMLAAAAASFPRTTRADRRLLWAVGRAQPVQPPPRELPALAFALSQKVEAGVKGELSAAALDAAKMTCLRLSDALGHPSRGLNFS